MSLALTRPSFPALGRPGLVRTILGPASHLLCVSRMWTVFHSFRNVYPEASSSSDYFSSGEQKQLLLF